MTIPIDINNSLYALNDNGIHFPLKKIKCFQSWISKYHI